MFQPFLQHLEKELFSRFDLTSRPIAPELEFQISQRGKNPAMIESWCYECPQLRKYATPILMLGKLPKFLIVLFIPTISTIYLYWELIF